METEEIVKILIVVVVLVVLVGAFMFLFTDKGTALLESIRNVLRFGK